MVPRVTTHLETKRLIPFKPSSPISPYPLISRTSWQVWVTLAEWTSLCRRAKGRNRSRHQSILKCYLKHWFRGGTGPNSSSCQTRSYTTFSRSLSPWWTLVVLQITNQTMFWRMYFPLSQKWRWQCLTWTKSWREFTTKKKKARRELQLPCILWVSTSLLESSRNIARLSNHKNRYLSTNSCTLSAWKYHKARAESPGKSSSSWTA